MAASHRLAGVVPFVLPAVLLSVLTSCSGLPRMRVVELASLSFEVEQVGVLGDEMYVRPRPGSAAARPANGGWTDPELGRRLAARPVVALRFADQDDAARWSRLVEDVGPGPVLRWSIRVRWIREEQMWGWSGEMELVGEFEHGLTQPLSDAALAQWSRDPDVTLADLAVEPRALITLRQVGQLDWAEIVGGGGGELGGRPLAYRPAACGGGHLEVLVEVGTEPHASVHVVDAARLPSLAAVARDRRSLENHYTIRAEVRPRLAAALPAAADLLVASVLPELQIESRVGYRVVDYGAAARGVAESIGETVFCLVFRWLLGIPEGGRPARDPRGDPHR